MSFKIALSILTLSIGAPNISRGQGALEGTVPLPALKATDTIPVDKYRGKISGRVAPPAAPLAGVWLEGPSLSAPANPPVVSVAQANYQFAKSLIVVPIGTTVEFPNKDSDYHNIYSLSRAKKFDLGRYKKDKKPAPSVLFDKAGFIKLRCEIHAYMKADIIVVNSPYYTTTDATGRFTLKGVPPGKYTLHARINGKKSWKIPVQVLSGKISTIQFPAK